ncbi:Hsp70 family protein [Amycolatopsis sp. NPDC059021]|uniref:Hsp70 family protein n=1 Tax=Amycolatopsis sp. NPDC059021 TaxID=3346704 RepID=UPI00366E13C0
MDVLSIDFGTSSTVGVLSAFGRGPRAIEIDGSVTMSSAVYAGEDGLLVVGQDAERRARLEPSRFEPNPKRRIDEGTLLLGDAVVEVTDAFAAVLRRIGEEAERQLNRPPDQVRISHPAGWGATRQEVLRRSAAKARLTDVRLVPEPVAAAAHYAALGDQPSRRLGPIAVYDLGAGTFDCSVVGITEHGFAVLAEDGLPDLGSLDIDQALLVHIGRSVSHADPAQWQRLLRPHTTADRRLRRALLQDVRDAKESLSRHPRTEVPMPEPFGDVLVTRDELEALVRPSLLRSAELLATTVRRAGLTPDRLGGIYLVGGPSRMPLLAGLLAQQLGVVPTTQDQPETAVAFGLHHVPLGGADPNLTVPAFAPVRPPVAPPPARQPWPGPPPVPQRPGPPPSPGPMGQAWRAPRPEPRHSAKKPLLIGAAVLVVIAVVVTTVLLVSKSDTPAAAPAENCAAATTFDQAGFTPCLRALAGTVPDRTQCSGNPAAAKTLNAVAAVDCTVRADLSGKVNRVTTISYYQGIDTAAVAARANLDLNSAKNVNGTWTGGGQRGSYVAGATGGDAGFVLFQVDGKPAVGVVVLLDRAGKPTAASMAGYFTEQVKPA